MPAAASRSFSVPVTREGIRDHYDQFAWAYRFYWGDHIHHGLFRNGETPGQAQEALLRHCAERAGVGTGWQVADVGCGHGGTARFLAQHYSCQVLGLTISETQCKLARKLSKPANQHGSVQFELADAEQYVWPSSRFHLIWNMESSEHFFDKPAYIRKAAAALKPAGRLMIAAWTGSMEDDVVREIARIFLCPQIWTADEYVLNMQAAGLKIVSREQLGEEVARTWDICAGHVRAAGRFVKLLPAQFREFADGINLMLEGYKTGRLTYSILVAEKPGINGI